MFVWGEEGEGQNFFSLIEDYRGIIKLSESHTITVKCSVLDLGVGGLNAWFLWLYCQQVGKTSRSYSHQHKSKVKSLTAPG